MKMPAKIEIIHQQGLFIMLLSSAVLFCASLIALVWNFFGMPSEIVLQFDAFHGILLSGHKASLFAIWLGALLLGGVNFVLAEKLFFRNRVLTYLVTTTTLIISFFALVAIGTIVSVN